MKAKSRLSAIFPIEVIKIKTIDLVIASGMPEPQNLTMSCLAVLPPKPWRRPENSLTKPPYTEAPQLTIANVELSLNMAQVNGHFQERNVSEAQRPVGTRTVSASMMRSGRPVPMEKRMLSLT